MRIYSIIPLCLLSFNLLSQDGGYNDGFSFIYNAAELGMKGKVKNVHNVNLKLNDQNIIDTGVTTWKEENSTHFNFNEFGNLISQYEVSAEKDTTIIILVTYNNAQQLAKVSKYYTSYNKTCKPSNLYNWTLDETNYKYANDLLVSAEYRGKSFHKLNDTKLEITYDSLDRMNQKIITKLNESKDTLYVNTYNYIGKTTNINNMITTQCEKRTSGVTSYTYDADFILTDKKFTPETFLAQIPWESEEKFWKYDAAGNCLESVHGDSLKWDVYIYDLNEFNQHNDPTFCTSIVDYDGIGHSKYNFTYNYDPNHNWTLRNTTLITYKRYGYGQTGTPDEFYKSIRKINYYD